MKEYLYPIIIPHSDVFFWSDLHLGHDKDFLWERRGFPNIQQHNTFVKNSWKTTIKYSSTVFILGDIMFGKDGEQRLYYFLREVPFNTMFLMPGNHMAGWKQLFSQSDSNGILTIKDNDGETSKHIRFCPNYLEVFIGKDKKTRQAIVLSHYPIASWNGQSKGSWNIHGHCHGNLSVTFGKAEDVGVEKHNIPVSFNKMKNLMDSRNIIITDHHNSNTSTNFS